MLRLAIFLLCYISTIESAVQPSNVKFRLHTRGSVTQPELIINGNDFGQLANHEAFDKTLPAVLTIHDHRGEISDEVNTNVKASTLQQKDANVFVVDWTYNANSILVIAAGDVDEVGAIVGNFIVYLKDLGVSLDHTAIIGFGLGAHVAGYAGKAVLRLSSMKVGEIVGLDPDGIGFNGATSSNRLDKVDAKFVQVIHCNTYINGYRDSIGTADFYPNGGGIQPGCLVTDLVSFGMCSHRRCPLLYAECIIQPNGCLSLKANSYRDFQNNRTIGNPTPLGLVDPSITGNYYLDTNSQPPYSLE